MTLGYTRSFDVSCSHRPQSMFAAVAVRVEAALAAVRLAIPAARSVPVPDAPAQ